MHDIVNSVVDDLINVQGKVPRSSNDSSEGNKVNQNEDLGADSADDDALREGLNEDQIKPLFLKFQGLEIDGARNEVLHAITQPQPQPQVKSTDNHHHGTALLKKVMNEIKHRVHDYSNGSWKCYLPPEDNPQGSYGSKHPNSDNNLELDLELDLDSWNPRIPFMRLPNDFFETLPTPRGYRDDGFTLNYVDQQLQRKWEDFTPEEKENYVRYPEEGGNGISPLFWFKYWDDKLCNGKGVR